MIRAGLLRLGGAMLGEVLSADRGHRGPRVPCGNGHEAVFTGYRDKAFDTSLGLVTVIRAWYHCTECGHGLAPRDAELGVAGASMSPGLAAMNDLQQPPYSDTHRLTSATKMISGTCQIDVHRPPVLRPGRRPPPARI